MQIELSQIINPTATTAIGVAAITTCGAVYLKRRWNLADRRQKEDDECERYENSYKVLSFWVRQKLQVLVTLSTMHRAGQCDDEYVIQRMHEMASEPTPLNDLTKYIDGTIEIDGIEKGA